MDEPWIRQNKRFAAIVVAASLACACGLGALYLIK